ncbi:MAG: UDP-N-acetylmuramoylalanine--D-glutamate ligase [Frankiaceae bacterium]|nr:UDP-N-acetylmuramoylalanine--D-glutamate ligase [Frankiaceae bacterium]
MSEGPDVSGPGLSGPELSGQRVLVVGVGLSGEAAARALAGRGALVVAVDDSDGVRQQAAAQRLREVGVDVRLGGLPTEPAADIELVVTSPGLRPTTPLLTAAARRGLEVWGEVELAYRWKPPTQQWLAVTGTNGKTTTTQMLAAILAADGRRSSAAGNIGIPLLDAVTAVEGGTDGTDGSEGTRRPRHDVLAVELSSFQLHYTSTLQVAAGAVLNLAEDHLDWHGSMDAYAADKGRVYSAGSTAVFNAADARTEALAATSAAGRRVGFRLGEPAAGELGLADGRLVDRAFADTSDGAVLLEVDALQVPGPHNVANALAAAALARAAGVDPSVIGAALAAFRPGGHRNEVVVEVAGRTYVNDSKATNPHAAAASLAAYDSVVWIAGGLNKGLAFDELIRGAAGRLRAAVLIGTCAEEIADGLRRHAPQVPVLRAGSMDDAVEQATKASQPGDTVLLAPAAASMDMFTDYAARGEAFAAAARQQEGAR